MALKDAVATVLNRNAFYRDGYRLLLRICLVQGVLIAILVVSIVSLLFTVQTQQVYFATSSDGRIINIVPTNEPYRSQAEVVAWTASVVKNVMRFDYKDYRERLQQASNNFTTTGWDSFSKAIKQSNILDAIEARKLVVSLELSAAPEIKNAFVKNGVYTWYLQIPVTIKFDGNEPPQPIPTMLILQVVRVSTLQNPEGISIEQWVAYKQGASR